MILDSLVLTAVVGNWQSTLNIGMIVVCVLVVVLALRKTRRSGKVSVENPLLGKFSVEQGAAEGSDTSPAELGAGSSTQTSGDSSPVFGGTSRHADCPYAMDFLVVISKSIRFGSEISEIKDRITIRDQMNVAQMKVDQYKNIVIKNFMNVLFRKKGAQINVMEDSSYLVYSYVSNEAAKNALMEIKGYFRENHLASYTDTAFEDYCADHAQKIISNFKMFINTMLPSFLDPARDEIEKEIAGDVSNLMTLMKDCFYTAREISIKYDILTRKREAEFDQEILEMTGVKNASKI